VAAVKRIRAAQTRNDASAGKRADCHSPGACRGVAWEVGQKRGFCKALDTTAGLQGRGAPAGSSCAGVQKSAVSTCAVSGASSSAAAAVAEESPASTAAERLDLPPTRLAVAGDGTRHPSVSCVTGCAVTGCCRLRSGAGGCRGPAGGFGSCHGRAQDQTTASDDQLVDPLIAAPRQEPPRGTGVKYEYLELAVPWRQQTRPVEY
jgi:hypothetical protein